MLARGTTQELQASSAAAMVADEPGGVRRTDIGLARAGQRGWPASGDGHGTGSLSSPLVSIGGRPAEAGPDGLVPAGWTSTDGAARILTEEGPGTYIDELLANGRASLTRWPVRGDQPIRFWVQPGAGLSNFVPEDRRYVVDAFEAWERAGIPLRFSQSPDSASADIIVVWTARFDEPISGKTRWMHDRRGWIRSARVTIALHRYTGELLDGDALGAIALHEVGHALGLDHSSDAENVMAPRVRVRALSDADRATARLLYRLPAGLRR